MKRIHLSLLLAFALLLCISPTRWVLAQDARGSISGSVSDISQAVLPGALVELQPIGKRVVSDAQGQFKISDLASGEYTISVSYVGFAPFTTTAKIAAGQTTYVNATLLIAEKADQVIVSGERLHGEAEAINIQRTAEDIVQVLPAKVITSLPNTNVADAVGRLPSVTLERDEGEGKYVQIRGTEPRLSNTTIDGVNVPSPEGSVRNVKLDVLPSGLVDRIEVNKTLSANQDGDAIGGSVNLVTKTAGERPTYTFGIQGGYTPIQDGRWVDGFDGTAGRRFGATKRLGALLGFTYDHNDRGIDDLEPLPVVGQDPVSGKNLAYFATEDMRTYKYYRTRYGFAGGLDYVIHPGTSAYARGLFSDFHDYGDTWVYTPNAGALVSQNGSSTQFDNTGNMQYRHYIRRPDQQIFSILSGVTHEIRSSILTLEFAGSRSHNIGGQDFATSNFNGPSNVQFTLNASDPYRPKFNAVDGTNTLDPTAYSMVGFSAPKSHSTQLNFQGSADLAQHYSLNSHYGTLAVGLKIRNAQKTQSESDLVYSNPDGKSSILLSQGLSAQSAPNYYDNSYKYGALTDYRKLIRLFQANSSELPLDVTASRLHSDPATYDANERVYAGYVMNSISWSKFRLQAGLRIEATDATYTANQVILNNGEYQSTLPVKGSSGYINLLPSVQLQYQIDPNTNLRASYGRGISRPNFSDIVPSQQIDPNTTPPSIVAGNPGLRATGANNFDLLVEHFTQPLGVLQGGFFYKQLNDPIYPTTTATTVGGKPGQLKQSVNGPDAYILGLELAWEQRLSRLPGLLGGFGVSANYSYTTSEVTFPSSFNRTDHAALQRQAPNTYNVGVTYDKARFSMRFGLSHNDENIYSYAYGGGDAATNKDPILGLKGPGGDQYLYAHTQYDLQGSYRLYKGLQFVASGLNLSNEVFGFYQGSGIYPIQREYYHPTASFGLRWTSTAE